RRRSQLFPYTTLFRSVGINTAIIGPAGGNVGIGFAVPSVLARAVMEQLVRFGEVKRGRLGISMQDVAGAVGAVLAEVQPGSPARSGEHTSELQSRENH